VVEEHILQIPLGRLALLDKAMLVVQAHMALTLLAQVAEEPEQLVATETVVDKAALGAMVLRIQYQVLL